MNGRVREILVAGHPALAKRCEPVTAPDPVLDAELADLAATLADFRRRRGFGRAIAAPQIGILKRAVAVHLGAIPFALLNPEITWRSDETFEVWDDCLSVPDVVVRVRRHRSIDVRYVDELGRQREWPRLPPELSELIQHEVDHLDGILMTERAVGEDAVRPIEEHAALVGAGRPGHRLSLASIAEAARTIDAPFLHTPQYECRPLSERLGCSLLLKIETLNPLRSFKGRGADHFVRQLPAEDRRPLVCASAGNFGQGLAWAARKRGRPLTVFASRNANPDKLQRMRELGAEVRLTGDDFDAAKDAAREHTRSGARMVEDGLEPAISEGAGSIAVELLARGDALDAVVVPVGNGALIGGVARWIKAASPATRVLGVCSAGADAMERSWRSGEIVERPSVSTIADGIAVRVPIAEAVADMRGIVDDVLLVDDRRIVDAIRLLFSRAGVVAEAAGAAGVAAVLEHPERFAGRNVATVICGSNLTAAQAAEWLG